MEDLTASILDTARQSILDALKEWMGKKAKKLDAIKERLLENEDSDVQDDRTQKSYIDDVVRSCIDTIKAGLIPGLLQELKHRDEEEYTLKEIKSILSEIEYTPPTVEKRKVPVARKTPKGPLLTTKDETRLKNTSHLCLQLMKEGYYIDPRTKIAFQQKSDHEWYAVGMYNKGGPPEELDDEHRAVCENNCYSIADWEEQDDLSPTPPEYPAKKKRQSRKKKNSEEKNTSSTKSKSKSKKKKKDDDDDEEKGEEENKKSKSKSKEKKGKSKSKNKSKNDDSE